MEYVFRVLAEKLRPQPKPQQIHTGSSSNNPHCVSCAMSMARKGCTASRLCNKPHMDNPSHHSYSSIPSRFDCRWRRRCRAVNPCYPEEAQLLCVEDYACCLSVVTEDGYARNVIQCVCSCKVRERTNIFSLCYVLIRPGRSRCDRIFLSVINFNYFYHRMQVNCDCC